MVAGVASVDEAWVAVLVDGAEVAARRLGCSTERTLTVYVARVHVDNQRHLARMASWIECGFRLGLSAHCRVVN